MDLYEQLKSMTGQPAPRRNDSRSEAEPDDNSPPQDDKAIPAALKGLLTTGRQLRGQRQQAGEERDAILAGIAGEVVESAAGPYVHCEQRFPYGELHGATPLQSPTALDWEALLRLVRTESPEAVDPARMAVIDTETTGLAGGTGTFAFLIGVGVFDDDAFVVHQFFMRDYCEEPAQLEAVRALLAQREVNLVVSYNGKSFDLPLLASRMIQNRLRDPLADVAHVDLLHPARRLWKPRLGQCDLGTVEAQVLGLQREGDIPGHLIPRVFFDYVRGMRVQRMASVFSHNVLDIVSLAALLGYLDAWEREYLSAEYPQLDRFCLGRSYETGDAPDRATQLYEQLLAEGLDDGSEEATLRLAIIYKRLEDFPRAVALWEQAIREAAAFNPLPYEELAKYYEHKAKDFGKARAIIEDALAYLELDSWVAADPFLQDGDTDATLQARLHKRLERVKGRQAKQEEKQHKKKPRRRAQS